MSATPPNFPSTIPVQLSPYTNWAQTITASQIWTCQPADADDVVAVCNWAKAQSPVWQVRAKGCAHGWSPLTIVEGLAAGANVILVDTTVSMNKMTFLPANGTTPAMIEAQPGVRMENLLRLLQYQPGGKGSAPGFGFAHVPAPGSITIGGVLAINGHGTAVPNANENFATAYGSMSNQITAFTAVVSSDTAPFDYELRKFQRGDPDASALLAHAGRAFIVSVTLQVIDNYNLRCQSFTDIDASTLFAAPNGPTPPANSLASFLAASGRVEAIWFPFTDAPWFKVWTVTPTQPAGSKAVSNPYNYAFADSVPSWVTTMIKQITTTSPDLTPTFTKAFANFSSLALSVGNLTDLWGPSMNTLLYVQDGTLPVTANGYAVQMKQADVQRAVHDFWTEFESLVASYAAKGQYPVNAPLEIRVTGLDDPGLIYTPAGQTAGTPLISALGS